ncbi:MAG: sulfurtransferase TusA family protein [Spirochaetes bacterium]|nr:sulfurtransferase TusA family protein [Spirochaetota bacterium]MBN2772003.1 sulfurtransferase TusA family protein [Spirochaetota bacterium]
MTKQIDARGLSCPQPLIMVQKAIKEGAIKLEVLLDSEVPKENITRFVQGRYGMQTSEKTENNEIVLNIFK